MPVSGACAQCAAVFTRPASAMRGATLFCSVECKRAHGRAQRATTCAHCTRAFFVHRGRQGQQRFCSQGCRANAQMAARRGHTPPPVPAGCVWLELGDGHFALIDAEDAHVLAEHMWYRHATNYAATKIAGRTVKLHQLLLPDGAADHRNRDRLDNRRSNLRYATAAQNGANRGVFANNTSGFKGVHHMKAGWIARVGVNGPRKYLGVFSTAEEAARAYDAAMLEAHGEFAVLNFPEPAIALAEGFAKPMKK